MAPVLTNVPKFFDHLWLFIVAVIFSMRVEIKAVSCYRFLLG